MKMMGTNRGTGASAVPVVYRDRGMAVAVTVRRLQHHESGPCVLAWGTSQPPSKKTMVNDPYLNRAGP